MVLKQLESMAPRHGYGIAYRVEQTRGKLISSDYGALYRLLVKLEQEGAIRSEWGVYDSPTTSARQSIINSSARTTVAVARMRRFSIEV